MTKRRKINIILVVLTILMAFFASVIYTLKAWEFDNFFTITGTLLIILITIANDVARITRTKKLSGFLKMLHFWGICSFLLIVPHTGETGSITREIQDKSTNFGPEYLIIATLAFLVLFVMALTSIQGFQPKWWKKFHRIVWMALPFIAVHLILVDYYLLAFVTCLPMVLPITGLFVDRVNLKIYFTQIIMMVVASLLIVIAYVFPAILLLFLKWSFLIIPLLMMLVSIFFVKNKSVKKLLFKYFLIAFVIIVIFIYSVN